MKFEEDKYTCGNVPGTILPILPDIVISNFSFHPASGQVLSWGFTGTCARGVQEMNLQLIRLTGFGIEQVRSES